MGLFPNQAVELEQDLGELVRHGLVGDFGMAYNLAYALYNVDDPLLVPEHAAVLLEFEPLFVA